MKKQTDIYRWAAWLRWTAAIFAAVAATAGIFDRIFAGTTLVDRAVEAVAGRAGWIAGSLAAMAMLLTLFKSKSSPAT